ncbi:MAG: VanZ family protein [Methyloligellaceae bacterium]
MQLTIVSLVVLGTIAGMLTPGLKPPFSMPDYLVHTITFFVCCLCVLSLNLQRYKAALTIMLIFAVGVEVGQFLVPARSPEVIDVACNIAGTLMASAVYRQIIINQT